MRRLPTLCLLVLAPLTGAAPQAQAVSLYNLLVGTYTEGFSEGIQVYRFGDADGSARGPLRVAHTSNPSYLIFASGQRTLFAVNGGGRGGKGDTVGRVTFYRFDPISGRLQQISQAQTLGDHPIYSSLSHDGRYPLVANYLIQPEGSVAVLPVRVDGSLALVVQVESHQASKMYPRQISGHVYSVVSLPDGQYLFAPDLDADKVFVYRYTPEQAERPLQAVDPAFVPTPPGSGLRHLISSADGRSAYLTLELSDQMMVFAHESNGRLRQSQIHDLAPVGSQSKVGASALHLSADGRFFGVLNRGDDNQLVTFAADPASGQLRFVERRSVEGTEPCEFASSLGGCFVLVVNQSSDQLRVSARSPQSGQVGKTLQSAEVESPSDLRFVVAP